jgi:uncharacterized protein involved in tellurium resistance
MSGSLSQKVHEKKIVRFTVSWSREDGLMNWSRNFKSPIAATRCRNEKIKRRFCDVGMFRNTKIYKTERLF